MPRTGKTSPRLAASAVFVDAAALTAFLLWLPHMRRPFDVLMLLLVALGVFTAAAVRRSIVRNIALVVISLALAAYLMEMAEKFFALTDLVAPQPSTTLVGRGGPYEWDVLDGASYQAAKERARADGMAPEILAEHFAGDVFGPAPPGGLAASTRAAGGLEAVTVGFKKLYRTGTELGYDLTPGNMVRDYGAEPVSGRMVFDAVYTVNDDGYRETRGDAGAAETYVFWGDSFTFGIFLNDDQTLPHHFSRLLGFEQNVMNLGVAGWGPHQCLRALQAGRFPGASRPIAPGRIRGVFFGLIDTQADRAVALDPKFTTTPYYVLENDRPVLRQRTARAGLAADLATMMEKSRVYPKLRDRLSARFGRRSYDDKWRLTTAILAEMDRMCRERFGVPMTVVYWDDDPMVMAMLRERGLDVVPVGDAFAEGEEWRKMAMKYLVFDGHPSVYANARLAEHLFGRMRDSRR